MRRSFLILASTYVLLLSAAFYWQLCADLAGHPANPRYYLTFQRARGSIFDRQGRALAFSTESGDGYVRNYAAPCLSPVVGYFHERYGITGLENLYQEELAAGRSLFTTLDLDLQQAAAELLGDRAGAVVLLEPSTGHLVMVSHPASMGALDERWPDYVNDVRSPFLNRATQGLYPPGSAVKPLVLGAALSVGAVDPNQTWFDEGSLQLPGGTVRNYASRAYGRINLQEALAHSSNVVFAELAVQLGEELLEYYRLFGLGQAVPFELANKSGSVPEEVASAYHAAQLGIGQGELLVTPLQIALAAAAIANGGVMMRPYLVQEVRGGLRMRGDNPPVGHGPGPSSDAAQLVKEAMALAAQIGTAQTERSSEFSYAGKTGTAQLGAAPDHSWFMGFAPVDAPQVAAAVVVEHGGTGAEAAVPVGVELMYRALRMSE